MAEAGTVVERSVAEMVARADVPERTNTVVTQENMNAWVDEKLGIKPAAPRPGEDGVVGGNGEDTVAGATAEGAPPAAPSGKPAEPQEGDVDGSKVYFKGKWVPKHDFDYRLHVKTQERTKELEDARKGAEAKARTEREAREVAERQASELRAKYEPPRTDELGPEPQPDQFANPTEYGKALKDWTAEATRREEGAKRQQEETAKAWNARKAAARKEIEDFDAVIDASKDVLLSRPLTEAVLDSEVGPKILHKLAKEPELADALNKMPPGRMLREFGRIEAELSKGAEKAAATPEKPSTPIAEVSRAPAPISPIRGTAAGVVTLKGSDDVPSNWSYEDWKAARQAGKIK